MIASSWLSKLQFGRHSLFQDFATLDTLSLVTNSFSLISRRIYEIILRQSVEIFRLPDIILYTWNRRRINIGNRTRRRNV